MTSHRGIALRPSNGLFVKIMRGVLVLSFSLNVLLLHERFYGRPDVTLRESTLKDAYFVRSNRDGIFIIDHAGHRFTAKCRASLTWLDGIDRPGKPMSDGGCTYMSAVVGKSIGDDLMHFQNNSIVYAPWTGLDTVQTADFLSVVDDQSIQ